MLFRSLNDGIRLLGVAGGKTLFDKEVAIDGGTAAGQHEGTGQNKEAEERRRQAPPPYTDVGTA